MNININLSDKKSIVNTVSKLKSLQRALNNNNEIVNEITDICYEKCFSNLEEMKIYPNTQFRAVKRAITKEPAYNGVGYVKIKDPATYVEFGMGLKGSSNSHPVTSKMGWQYDDRTGWVYSTDAEASNPKKWKDKDGNWYGWTTGMPSRPFAYEAAQYTKEVAKDKVIEKLNEIIGK